MSGDRSVPQTVHWRAGGVWRAAKPLFRVHWQGESPEGDIWLPADELGPAK
jgi:hypothetical protein